MNKKFVRAFALVLAALMCLSLLPLAARADEGHVCQFTPVRTEPTCGEEGYVQMTCEVCGNAGEIIEWIPPTGAHTFMDVVNDDYLFEESDNLCLRPARYWKACAVCGAAAEEAHTEALNKLYEEINQRKNNGEEHTNEEWQKITEDAVKEVDAQYTFSFGGEGHSWVSYERQEATCTSDGWEAYRQCSACGAIDGEYPRIPAKGHRWGEFTVTKEPTCTEDGSKERVCEVCGEKETAAIPALGHTWGEFTVITEPKCEEDGLKEHTCEVCGATESVAIPALGHSWGAFTVTRPATCTVDGEQEHTCAACGKKETEIIPAGHKWGEWVVTVEPGCYSSGERTRTCTVCGEKETEAIAPAHKWGEWVVVMEPTCYSTGEERSTCTVCGETESRWLDMAHKYENGVCVFCGEAQPDAPAVTGTEEPAAETEEGSTEEHTNDTDETPANEPEAEGDPAADVPYTGIQNADAVKNGEIVDEAYVGNVLTAAVTPADHEYIYQWYRIAGEEIEEIPGAYDKSYRLTEEDIDASVYCYVDDEEGSDATTYAVDVLPAELDPNPAPAEEAAAEEAEKSNTLEEAETFAAAEPTVTMENSSAETLASFTEATGIAADPASITAQNVTPVGANGEKLDNDAVAAAGGVTFEMPLPENYKSGDDIEIYHQNSETGAWEKITNYTVADGKVIIREQKDFSAFIVVDKNGNLVEAETFGGADSPIAEVKVVDVTDVTGDIDPSDYVSRPQVTEAFESQVLLAIPLDTLGNYDPTNTYGYRWVRNINTEISGATNQTYTVTSTDVENTIYCSVYVRPDISSAKPSNGIRCREEIVFPVIFRGDGTVTIDRYDPIQNTKFETLSYSDSNNKESIVRYLPTLTEYKVSISVAPDISAGESSPDRYYVRRVIEFDGDGKEVKRWLSASKSSGSFEFDVSKSQQGHIFEIYFDKVQCRAEIKPGPIDDDIVLYNDEANQNSVRKKFEAQYVKEPGTLYSYRYVSPHWAAQVAANLTNDEITVIGGFTFKLPLPDGVTSLGSESNYDDYDIRVYHYVGSDSWEQISFEKVLNEDAVEVKKFSNFSPFAVVARPTYKATLDGGEHGTITNLPNPITADDKGDLILPQPVFTAAPGWTFAGWQVGTELKQPGDIIHITEDTTVTAKWLQGFTITFNDNDLDNTDTYGALVTGTMKQQFVYLDEDGDYVDKDGNKLYFDKNGNVVVYIPPEEPPEGAEKASYKLTKCAYSLTNHTFMGWALSQGKGQDVVYSDENFIGDFYSETPKPIKTDTTLYAVWKRTGVTISFNGSGASPGAKGPVKEQHSSPGSSITLNPYNTDTKEPEKGQGFVPPAEKLFGGWDTDPSASNVVYKNAATITTPETDTTLYAVWRDKLRISFNPISTSEIYGGKGTGTMATQVVPSGVESPLQENQFTAPSGKAFAFWSDKQDGTGNQYYSQSKYSWTNDTYLYAQWGNEITITYLPNGGDGPTKREQNVAEEVNTALFTFAESGFYRKDYKFLGWDPIATKKDNPLYQAGETVEGGFKKDTTLYAIWEQTDFVGTVLVTGSQSGVDPTGYWEETLTCEVAGEPKYMIAGYQWMHDGEPILGATSDKYVPNEEDYGKTITCAVKAYDPDDPGPDPEHPSKFLDPPPESNPKHIITQEIEVKEIHDDGLTLSAYKYGLMPNMTYTLNGIDQGKVILDSQNRMAFTKGGTYKFFDKDGKLVSIVEVENWYTLSYTVTNRVTTSSTSSSGSSGSKTSTSSTSTTSSGGGTVRMYNGSSQLTSAAVVDPNTGEVIIKANGSITTSSGSWLVREGANTDLKMVVAPSSNSFAYVNLNGSSYQSLGSGEKTVTVSPMNTYKHYEIVFANATSSPKTADESHLGMWSALCFTSLVAASAILTRSRRRRKNEK